MWRISKCETALLAFPSLAFHFSTTSSCGEQEHATKQHNSSELLHNSLRFDFLTVDHHRRNATTCPPDGTGIRRIIPLDLRLYHHTSPSSTNSGGYQQRDATTQDLDVQTSWQYSEPRSITSNFRPLIPGYAGLAQQTPNQMISDMSPRGSPHQAQPKLCHGLATSLTDPFGLSANPDAAQWEEGLIMLRSS